MAVVLLVETEASVDKGRLHSQFVEGKTALRASNTYSEQVLVSVHYQSCSVRKTDNAVCCGEDVLIINNTASTEYQALFLF